MGGGQGRYAHPAEDGTAGHADKGLWPAGAEVVQVDGVQAPSTRWGNRGGWAHAVLWAGCAWGSEHSRVLVPGMGTGVGKNEQEWTRKRARAKLEQPSMAHSTTHRKVSM